ncbi:hypothetical protein [Parafilimonas sp.]|uniref:hypothetical protein n=1 Tax=Parafilimonas sp. TaxID=1969739 RepID=UPI0039E3820B
MLKRFGYLVDIGGLLFFFFININNIVLGQNADKGKIVDRYGQLIKAGFKAKVLSDDELKEDVGADKDYYANLHPPVWDKYGGLPGSGHKFGFQPTGSFHIEKWKNRTLLVDPLGNLYFSLGVNGVSYTGDTYTKVNGRENIYEWLPEFTLHKDNKDYRFNKAYLNDNDENLKS